MTAIPTVTAIAGVQIVATSADINAAFQGAAAEINALPASDKFTYDGVTPIPSGSANGHSILIIPATATGNIDIPIGYQYVVVANGSNVSLSTTSAADYRGVGVYRPTIIGDGYNFSGSANAFVGGGNSTISNGPGYYGGNGMTRYGGTGTVVAAGQIVASAGSNIDITTESFSHNFGSVSVEAGASTTIHATGAAGMTLDSGSTNRLFMNGYGMRLQIGAAPPVTPTPPPPAPTVPSVLKIAAQASTISFTNVVTDASSSGSYYGPSSINIYDPTSINEIALGTGTVLNAAAGASTVFGGSGDTVSVGGGGTASLFFVGSATGTSTVYGGASSVYGAATNVTLFANAGQVLDLGDGFNAAQANVFVGGANGASTINAGTGGGDFFGGRHGDLYNSGTSRSQIFVGLGGADTINNGTGGNAPLTYAFNGEHLTMEGAAASTIVAFTANGVVDASRTVGNNVLFAGYGGGGSETLIGSTSSFDSVGNSTHDTFVVGANPGGTASSLVIDNWHGGDVFFLAGFTPNDTSVMDNAIATNLVNGSKGDLSFTLSDKTTVSFIGSHPTNFSGNAAF